MGYSLFKVTHQVDTIGNRLKEVQDSVQDLAKFGKMVQLVSFLPFEYEYSAPWAILELIHQGMASKLWSNYMISRKASHRSSCAHFSN